MTDPSDAPAPEEESARRLKVEVERLSRLSHSEWTYYLSLPGYAEKYGVDAETFTKLVKAEVAKAEKQQHEDKAEARRAKADDQREKQQKEKKRAREERLARQEEARKLKEAERVRQQEEKRRQKRYEEFERISQLPRISYDLKLIEAAKRLGEDVGLMRAEFAACCTPDPTDTRPVTPWEEPVDTRALLEDLVAQVQRYIVIRDLDVVAVALWILFAWLHDIAIHSPILLVTSAEDDDGKTRLCKIIARLTPRALFICNPTSGNLYRIVDHERPTLVVDNADKLLVRDADLVEIVNSGWVRGTPIPRVVRGEMYYFDPFCPKCLNMIGLQQVPFDTLGRCIIVRVLKKLAEERIERFGYVDNPDFIALRRRCMRWAADNAPALQHAYPEDFDKRFADNWRLQLLAADLAGGNWPRQARAAAVKTARKPHQRAVSNQFLADLRPILEKHKAVGSGDLAKMLGAMKDSEWSNYRGHGPITWREISLLLDFYDIHPEMVQPPQGPRRRGYKLEWFTEIFRRYLPPDSQTTAQPHAPQKSKRPSKSRKS